MNERDVVAMVQDDAAAGLRRGDVGAVVHIYADGSTYDVEFVGEGGKTKSVATVPASVLMKLNFLSISA